MTDEHMAIAVPIARPVSMPGLAIARTVARQCSGREAGAA